MFGIAVVVVMCLELFRRPLDSWHGEFLQSAGKYKKLLRECAPEAAGALCCVVLVAMLRFRGDTISGTLDAHSLEAQGLLTTGSGKLERQSMTYLAKLQVLHFFFWSYVL
eukprot:g13002.t1